MHIVDQNGSKLAFLFKEKMLFADVNWVIRAFDSYEKMKKEIVMGIFQSEP